MNKRVRIHVERKEEMSVIFTTHDDNIQNCNIANLKIRKLQIHQMVHNTKFYI